MMRLYVCHAAPTWYAREPGTPAVKIGISKEPKRRKWGLRRKGCEHPKLVWQSTEIERARAFAIENALKKRLAARCVQGTEWFDLRPDLAVRIVQDAIREYRTPQQWKEAKRHWFDKAISEAEAAKRAGIPGRTMRRKWGPRGTEPFGGKQRKGKA
jgi:hypothetical protein